MHQGRPISWSALTGNAGDRCQDQTAGAVRTSVRTDVIGREPVIVLASDTAPINVDVPEEFCGLTLVGPALLTLDERIARAGIGVPPTYREQQKWLEARKTQEPASAGPAVASHQADLDRFYRNVHQGLRGILSRVKANPGSCILFSEARMN